MNGRHPLDNEDWTNLPKLFTYVFSAAIKFEMVFR